MPSSSELQNPSSSGSSSSEGEGSDVVGTGVGGSHSESMPTRPRDQHFNDDYQSYESSSIPDLTLSPEQRTAIERSFSATRAEQSQRHANTSRIQQTLGLHGAHQVLSPLSPIYPSFVRLQPWQPQLDQAALLQMQLRQQPDLVRSQQSLGLLAPNLSSPALPENALQAAAFALLNNNALSLLQLQQQQQSLLHPLVQIQPDLLAPNVATTAFQAQQLQLARQQQLLLLQQQQQQQQQILSAASLPLPQNPQVNSPLALALGAANPQVAMHLAQGVPPRAAGLVQHCSHSSSSSSSAESNKKASPPPERLKKPKRPLSSYNFFFKASRKKIRAEEPDIGFEDLAKRIGKQWGKVDPEALAEYEAEAQKDRERYWRELEVYKASMDVQLEKKRAARKRSVSDDFHESFLARLKSGKKQKRR